MQPYVNPYLFQTPYYSGYGNNISQNIQNAYNPIGINGKYVNDFNEINASDVPMGSQPSIFVKNDKSEIQLREWSPNGQIVSMQFVPFVAPVEEKKEEIIQQPSIDINAEIITPIFKKISELEDKLDKLNKPVNTGRTKKDGE